MSSIAKFYPWIDGKYLNTPDEKYEELCSPWSGDSVCKVYMASQSVVDSSIESAKKAYLLGLKETSATRAEWLRAAASEVEKIKSDTAFKSET